METPTVLGVIVLVLSIAGPLVLAVLEARKAKNQKVEDAKNEREESAQAGDLDIEHLDRERLRRLQK
jgi:hypothetical protein